MKKADIQNTLDSLQQVYPELVGLVLQNSDARLGRKVALARKGESDTIQPKTDFLTLPEMHRFLQGYSLRADNRLGAPVKQLGIIQLSNCDGEDAGLFQFDANKINALDAKQQIEEALAASIEEDNPLDAAEGILEPEGITRIYVDLYAETNVI